MNLMRRSFLYCVGDQKKMFNMTLMQASQYGIENDQGEDSLKKTQAQNVGFQIRIKLDNFGNVDMRIL